MKRGIITTMLLLLCAGSIHAQQAWHIDNPACMPLLASETLDSVTGDADKTTLHFTLKADSAERHIVSPVCYLVDSHMKRYRLKGVDGIAIGSLLRFDRKQSVSYALHFEPLPANTPCFDFMHDPYGKYGSAIYAIRRQGTPLPMMKQDTAQSAEGMARLFPDDAFAPGSVTVCGTIDGFAECGYKGGALSFTMMRPFPSEKDANNTGTKIPIDSRGCFEGSIPVDGPLLSQLYLFVHKDSLSQQTHYKVPVMLYPKDTLRLRLSAMHDCGQRVDVESGVKETMPLSALPVFCPERYTTNNSIWRYRGMEKKEAAALAIKNMERMDSLALYLGKKYGLGSTNVQLLRTEAAIGEITDLLWNCGTETNRLLRQLSREGEKPSVDSVLQAFMAQPEWDAVARLRRQGNSLLAMGGLPLLCRNMMYNYAAVSLAASCKASDLWRKGDESRVDYYGTHYFVNQYIHQDSVRACFIQELLERIPDNALLCQAYMLGNFDGQETYKLNSWKPTASEARQWLAHKRRFITHPALKKWLDEAVKHEFPNL